MTAQYPDPDFLLDTPQARRLYHEVAADLPIVDFHNHLDPQAILDDRKWASLGEIWLEGDHYKWRAMRWNGVNERLVSGDADYHAKYMAFAETVPYCLGNPLYHWTHLELVRYFDWDGGLFGPDTAQAAWDKAAEMLPKDTHGARGLLRGMKVEYVGTTDDPCDDLAAHITLNADPSVGFAMAPSFRPDQAIKCWLPGFGAYLERLSKASAIDINSFETLIEALETRLDVFVAAGCKASDHGLDGVSNARVLSPAEASAILDRARRGDVPNSEDCAAYQNAVLTELGRAYAERGIVMQMHIGAVRNSSTRLFKSLGADVGGDSINDAPFAAALNGVLDRIEQTGTLPKTILYGLNPGSNTIMVTTAGNFQDGSTPGKIQAGSGWWFNDQLDGMQDQMTQLAQMGLLSRFVGMLTDSRSFLSFPRHEYFRRLLCQMIGRWVASGEFPDAPELTDRMVRDICYENAKDWFL